MIEHNKRIFFATALLAAATILAPAPCYAAVKKTYKKTLYCTPDFRGRENGQQLFNPSVDGVEKISIPLMITKRVPKESLQNSNTGSSEKWKEKCEIKTIDKAVTESCTTFQSQTYFSKNNERRIELSLLGEVHFNTPYAEDDGRQAEWTVKISVLHQKKQESFVIAEKTSKKKKKKPEIKVTYEAIEGIDRASFTIQNYTGTLPVVYFKTPHFEELPAFDLRCSVGTKVITSDNQVIEDPQESVSTPETTTTATPTPSETPTPSPTPIATPSPSPEPTPTPEATPSPSPSPCGQ